MSIDVSKIKKGDRVKISTHSLPESGWLEVTDVDDRCVSVVLPRCWAGIEGYEITSHDGVEITAHEPAAPALPHWWGSLVIEIGEDLTYGLWDGKGYRLADGNRMGAYEVDPRDVNVIVDQGGNLPAVDDVSTLLDSAWEELATAKKERDKWKSLAEEREAALNGLQDSAMRVARHRDRIMTRNVEQQLQMLTQAVEGREAARANRNEERELRKRTEAERDKARADLAAFRPEVEDLRNDVPYLTDHQIKQRLSAILNGAEQ